MSYTLLHEAGGVEEELAHKYGVPTFEDYKLDTSSTNSLTEFQQLVFTIVYAIHCGGQMPRCLVINRQKALDLIEEDGEIPQTIEGVPLAFDEKQLFRQCWLA